MLADIRSIIQNRSQMGTSSSATPRPRSPWPSSRRRTTTGDLTRDGLFKAFESLGRSIWMVSIPPPPTASHPISASRPATTASMRSTTPRRAASRTSAATSSVPPQRIRSSNAWGGCAPLCARTTRCAPLSGCHIRAGGAAVCLVLATVRHARLWVWTRRVKAHCEGNEESPTAEGDVGWVGGWRRSRRRGH